MKQLTILMISISNNLFAQLENTQILITSVRTGDTEIFAVNPVPWNTLSTLPNPPVQKINNRQLTQLVIK